MNICWIYKAESVVCRLKTLIWQVSLHFVSHKFRSDTAACLGISCQKNEICNILYSLELPKSDNIDIF